MNADTSSREFLEPWVAVSPEERYLLETELRKELQAGHALSGVAVAAVARRRDNDDVLFAVQSERGEYAQVHLTWAGRPDRISPKWPSTSFFRTWEEFVETGMRWERDAWPQMACPD